MAFQEVTDLSCEVTVSLGGVNKKTNKPNPTKLEGYYLGYREVDSKMNPGKKDRIHAFQTQKGNVGVWGKTDLDRKLDAAIVGALTRVSFDKMVPSARGSMYKFKVEIDKENVIETLQSDSNVSASNESFDDSSAYEADDEVSFDSEEDAVDEIVPPQPKRPATPAQAPDPARQAKVQALLNSARNKSTS